jgi:hypothetical protein
MNFTNTSLQETLTSLMNTGAELVQNGTKNACDFMDQSNSDVCDAAENNPGAVAALAATAVVGTLGALYLNRERIMKNSGLLYGYASQKLQDARVGASYYGNQAATALANVIPKKNNTTPTTTTTATATTTLETPTTTTAATATTDTTTAATATINDAPPPSSPTASQHSSQAGSQHDSQNGDDNDAGKGVKVEDNNHTNNNNNDNNNNNNNNTGVTTRNRKKK